MKISVQENQVMTHLQGRFPKGSSLKRLNEDTGRSRSELTEALKGLAALMMLSVSKKDEVVLRAAGKQHLGIVATNSNKPKSKPVDIKKTNTIKISPKPKGTVKENTPSSVVFEELETLSRQLQEPIIALKNKAEKVKLLADLSEKLKPSVPYISEQLLEIANVIHGLNEAA